MKKLIAILLTLTLVAGMLPMVFAAEATGTPVDDSYDESYEYIFNYSAHESTYSAENRELYLGHRDLDDMVDGSPSDPWGFVNAKSLSNLAINSENLHWAYSTVDNQNVLRTPSFSTDGSDTGVKSAIAFEIVVGQKGTYRPTIYFNKYIASANLEVYLIKKPSSGAWYYNEYETMAKAGDGLYTLIRGLDESDRIGYATPYMNAATLGACEEQGYELKERTLEKGNYFLILIPNGAEDGWANNHVEGEDYKAYYCLNKFTLDPIAPIEKEELEYITALDVFRTDKMQWGTEGYSTGEVIRKSGSGLLYNTSLMSYDAQATYITGGEQNKDDEGNVVPYYVMDGDIKTVSSSGVLTKAGDGVIDTNAWRRVKNTAASAYISFESDAGWYQNVELTLSSAGSVVDNVPVDAVKGGNYNSGHFGIISIRVPHAGTYKLSLKSSHKYATGMIPAVYFVPESTGTAIADIAKSGIKGYFNSSSKDAETLNAANPDSGYTISDLDTDGYQYISEVTVPVAGDYYLCLDPDANSFKFNSEATPGKKTVEITNDDETKESVTYIYRYHQPMTVTRIKLTPVITDAEKAEAAEIAAAAEKKAEIMGETGAPTVSTANAGTSKTVQQLKAILDGEATVVNADVTVTDGYATVTADATDADGNTFMYWVKGLATGEADKKVVSTSASYTFKPSTGNNMLIAVYKSKDAGDKSIAKIYNRNGQLLATKDASFKIADLETPSMPGYGDAIAWADGYGNEYAVGADDEIAVDGEVVLVAKYKETADTYTITVKHQDGDNAAETVEVKEEVAYGTEITLTAPSRYGKSGYNTFNYWINEDNEIVGLGKSYTFNAWKDCTITAVYKEYSPSAAADSFKKVLLGTLSGNTLMAEFIGFGDAAEKGIMIGTKMYSMTGEGNQFTINNDLNDGASAKAYVIDGDGKVYYSDEVSASAE